MLHEKCAEFTPFENIVAEAIVTGVIFLQPNVFLYLRKTNVFGDVLESACLSIHVSVFLSGYKIVVCVKVCGGIGSHLVTALVYIMQQ